MSHAARLSHGCSIFCTPPNDKRDQRGQRSKPHGSFANGRNRLGIASRPVESVVLRRSDSPRDPQDFNSSLAPIRGWASKPLDPRKRLRIVVQLDTYGLTLRWYVSGAISYSAFKRDVVHQIVPRLATKDAYFPFASREPDAYQLSSDALNDRGRPGAEPHLLPISRIVLLDNAIPQVNETVS